MTSTRPPVTAALVEAGAADLAAVEHDRNRGVDPGLAEAAEGADPADGDLRAVDEDREARRPTATQQQLALALAGLLELGGEAQPHSQPGRPLACFEAAVFAAHPGAPLPATVGGDRFEAELVGPGLARGPKHEAEELGRVAGAPALAEALEIVE
jgi:hypothetical protein